MKLAIVYDNSTLDPNLSPGWGFSCLVGDDLLFDTGGDGPRLLSNMGQMGLDVGGIKTVVLSHAHGDHTGGLGGILAANNKEIAVYMPRSFPSSFKAQVRARARLTEVWGPMEITEGIYTTGETGQGLIEQSLVLVTGQGPSTGSEQGLVVITGCAHPGIVSILERAKEVASGEIYLVLGGFHLGSAGKARIANIISDFRQLGVQKVAPCHCTGGRAMTMFANEYGEDFIQMGVGKVLEV